MEDRQNRTWLRRFHAAPFLLGHFHFRRYVPWLPCSHHLLDGFFYAAGLLLVRQAARCQFLRRLWTKHPVLVRASLGFIAIVCLAPWRTNRHWIWARERDRRHRPPPLRPWPRPPKRRRAPRLTWEEQVRLSEAFYKGALDRGAADALLTDFGVRYVVVTNESPAAAYFSNQAPAIRIELAVIYRIDNAGLRPFTPLHHKMIGK